MKKPVVIYHGNCVDGFGAAWCFWHKYKDDAIYVPGVYNEDPIELIGENIYLVDFSYKRKTVEKLLDNNNSVTLIDHHKTAIEDLSGLPGLETYCDINKSGATLAWSYLFPFIARPLLLGYIEDRDLWKFKLDKSREVAAGLFSFEYDFHIWDKLMLGSYKEILELTVAGAAIERKHHKDIKELLEANTQRMIFDEFRVPAVNLPYTYSSDAGMFLARSQPFAVCYWDIPYGRQFSLRSVDSSYSQDVSILAARYGGGGHKHAAGFKVDKDHIMASNKLFY